MYGYVKNSGLVNLDVPSSSGRPTLGIHTIKIKQNIPKRIEKLTNIKLRTLQKKGYFFEQSMKLIDKFVKNKSILIANGDDLELLKMNIKNHLGS